MKFRKFAPVIILMMVLAFANSQQACSQAKKEEVLTVKSSVVCGQCKDRVEQGLAYEKGIKDVNVDLDKKTVIVKYNPAKTDPGKIRDAIAKIGYDADDVKADKTAYDKLPPCCKKDAASHK
jgi:periplasmic mercuric ion binding protein